jgi:hypothetical protein
MPASETQVSDIRPDDPGMLFAKAIGRALARQWREEHANALNAVGAASEQSRASRDEPNSSPSAEGIERGDVPQPAGLGHRNVGDSGTE